MSNHFARLISLDVFRGFDMMFIMGLQGVCVGVFGLFGALGPAWGGLVWGVVYFAALWGVLYFLYRKQVFFKV